METGMGEAYALYSVYSKVYHFKDRLFCFICQRVSANLNVVAFVNVDVGATPENTALTIHPFRGSSAFSKYTYICSVCIRI